MRPTISLNVVTYNEAARIKGCLLTVADEPRNLVNEVVVVDQGSTDETAEIAEFMGAKVVRDSHHGFADPSRPLAERESSCDWILALDADERCTNEFRGFLAHFDPPADLGGYELERANWFGGQFWSTDWHLRLWRRGRVAWPDFDRPHRRWQAWPGLSIPAALEHRKSWAEQLADDAAYERLGSGTGPFLALARARGVSGAELDAMPVDEAKAIGFDCQAVRVAA